MTQIPTELLPHLAERNTAINAFFDARGLACPMPLLKAKVSLRTLAGSESLYLVASDKNSQTDLVAYCQKNNLAVQTWVSEGELYHFIITKADFC